MSDQTPAAVTVENTEPIAVEVIETPSSDATHKETVAEHGRDTAEQRDINRIWQRTQQVVALSVVEVTLVVITVLVVMPGLGVILGNQVPDFMVTASVAGMLFLTGVANLVIGFYFGRTDHTRVAPSGTPGRTG